MKTTLVAFALLAIVVSTPCLLPTSPRYMRRAHSELMNPTILSFTLFALAAMIAIYY